MLTGDGVFGSLVSRAVFGNDQAVIPAISAVPLEALKTNFLDKYFSAEIEGARLEAGKRDLLRILGLPESSSFTLQGEKGQISAFTEKAGNPYLVFHVLLPDQTRLEVELMLLPGAQMRVIYNGEASFAQAKLREKEFEGPLRKVGELLKARNAVPNFICRGSDGAAYVFVAQEAYSILRVTIAGEISELPTTRIRRSSKRDARHFGEVHFVEGRQSFQAYPGGSIGFTDIVEER